MIVTKINDENKFVRVHRDPRTEGLESNRESSGSGSSDAGTTCESATSW